MANIQDAIDTLEAWFPVATADDWDAPGLVCGDRAASLKGVLLTIDLTAEVLDEAEELGASLIVAHHPFLLKGVRTIDEASVKGSILAKAVRAGIAVYAAHTNADIAEHGVSEALAIALGLGQLRPLVGSRGVGHGRLGVIAPVTLGEFAQSIAQVLPATAGGVKVAGDFSQQIRAVALCAGAGDSFIEAAVESGADVYITSDLRHHPVQDARALAAIRDGKPALIDIAHWAAEYVWLEALAPLLVGAGLGAPTHISQVRTDPWDFLVTQ